MDMREYKLKSGNILRVEQDNDPESPNDWDNEDVFLVYDHRQFYIKREGFEPRDIFDHLQETGTNDKFDDYFIFPVYAYIHSGVSLSLDNSQYPFNDRWDVSSTGFVLVKKVEIISNLGEEVDHITEPEEKTKEWAEGLIEAWNQYLSGDVWRYIIFKPVKTYTITEEELNKLSFYNDAGSACEIIYTDNFKEIANISLEYAELDSCGGFYGKDPRTNGMLDNINDKLVEDE